MLLSVSLNHDDLASSQETPRITTSNPAQSSPENRAPFLMLHSEALNSHKDPERKSNKIMAFHVWKCYVLVIHALFPHGASIFILILSFSVEGHWNELR